MNDRIKELAEQAGLYAFVSDNGVDLDIEKFAELVRQDVIDQITVVRSGDEVVAVTLTDEEHRILQVVWEKTK